MAKKTEAEQAREGFRQELLIMSNFRLKEMCVEAGIDEQTADRMCAEAINNEDGIEMVEEIMARYDAGWRHGGEVLNPNDPPQALEDPNETEPGAQQQEEAPRRGRRRPQPAKRPKNVSAAMFLDDDEDEACPAPKPAPAPAPRKTRTRRAKKSEPEAAPSPTELSGAEYKIDQLLAKTVEMTEAINELGARIESVQEGLNAIYDVEDRITKEHAQIMIASLENNGIMVKAFGQIFRNLGIDKKIRDIADEANAMAQKVWGSNDDDDK